MGSERRRKPAEADPMDPVRMTSLKHWGEPHADAARAMGSEVAVECGWGRVLFGQTFHSAEHLASALRAEEAGRRDIGLYIRDPHVVLSLAPQHLFIDPSHTFRLDLRHWSGEQPPCEGWRIRAVDPRRDEASINRIYRARSMVPVREGFYGAHRDDPKLLLLVAADERTDAVLGVVAGIDHVAAFDDPDGGASLWALAVDPQCTLPRLGEALVTDLARRLRERGRRFMDLSVVHTNVEAIRLYERLGFARVPVYCMKNKNPINERLYIGPDPVEQLNIYARIIVDEARRRGILVEVLDAANGYFRLTHGGRTITCRESLSELTSAIAMSRCDDKRVTLEVLRHAGVRVPDQTEVDGMDAACDFLARHGSVVVKPARGEQGRGVRVDVRTEDELARAIEAARRHSDVVIVEEYVRGQDLRVIVIDYQVVAAATRRPAEIAGDGASTALALIEKHSQRRQRSTGGESRIPIDAETRACLADAGYTLDSVIPEGERLTVRKTANLHTGGTIHDVTDQLHPDIREVAQSAARALGIPVVGFDFIMPDLAGNDYVIIEANERPGLANHEPQPTAERFVNLLFPQTRPA